MSNDRINTKFVIVDLDKEVTDLTKKLIECWYGEDYALYLDEATLTRSDEVFSDILTDLGMMRFDVPGAVQNAVTALREIEEDNLVDDTDTMMTEAIIKKSAKSVLKALKENNVSRITNAGSVVVDYTYEREIGGNSFLLRRVDEKQY